MYQDVRRYDRVPPAKILLMPYGIRLTELDSPLSKSEAKAELGISGFCLGTIGRLEEQKGQEFLLAAVPELRAHIPDLNVIIVGDGRLRPHLENQARTLGITENRAFPGHPPGSPPAVSRHGYLCPPFLMGGYAVSAPQSHGRGLAGNRHPSQWRRRYHRGRQQWPFYSPSSAGSLGPGGTGSLCPTRTLAGLGKTGPRDYSGEVFFRGHVDSITAII